MAKEVKISTLGMNCPKTLIETRKALRKMNTGEILIVEGDHKISKDEIPQAMEDTGEKVLDISEAGGKWTIKIQKGS